MDVLLKLRETNWRLVAAALVAIGILHIVATLAAPELTVSRAVERLGRDLPLNAMQILPPLTPATQRLPFMSPDARYAVCRFDTSEGAVALLASLPGPGWVLALYSAEGDNFFASVARPERRSDISLLLVPSDERDGGLVADPRRTAKQEQGDVLTIAAQSGLALIRAPDQGEAYRERNLAELKRARCAVRKR
jgi:uncharacterized membrane protein